MVWINRIRECAHFSVLSVSSDFFIFDSSLHRLYKYFLRGPIFLSMILDYLTEEFFTIYRLWKKSRRNLLQQFVALGLAVGCALILWKSLMILTFTESPIVVVLSGSMEPAFYRGDLLMLELLTDVKPLDVGDIVVFKIQGKEIPIVHRIMRMHVDAATDEVFFLTKGDNNAADDRVLYRPGQNWISRSDIVGRARVCLPKAGMVTLVMNDFPMFKYILLGFLGILVITNKCVFCW